MTFDEQGSACSQMYIVESLYLQQNGCLTSYSLSFVNVFNCACHEQITEAYCELRNYPANLVLLRFLQ